MTTQENTVNYEYTGEQSELFLHRRTERIMTTQENRVNYVYKVEWSVLCL
jgi:hypothetical protein